MFFIHDFLSIECFCCTLSFRFLVSKVRRAKKRKYRRQSVERKCSVWERCVRLQKGFVKGGTTITVVSNLEKEG